MPTEPKTIQIPELLEQPTYKYLINNIDEIKNRLCEVIHNMPMDTILTGITSQANKGLVKYDNLIDDNNDFDADTYCNEEIFDALVYQANSKIKKDAKNPFYELSKFLKAQ